MLLHGARQLGGIASCCPILEQRHLLLRRHRLQRRVVIEKTLNGGHERRAPGKFEENQREIVVDNAELFESSVRAWARPARHGEHRAVNIRPLSTSAAQRLPPRR